MTNTKEQKLKKNKWKPSWYISASISVAVLILSFSITIQYNTQQKAANSLESQSTDDLVSLVRNLNEKRDRLETELDVLNRSYVSLDAVESIEKQLQQLAMFVGTTPIMGSGVSVTITADSPLLNLDLIDIVNELKASGAEAIAVNNVRLTSKSKFDQEKDDKGNIVILLDKKKLLTPIVITAIGHPATLEKGLIFTGGIIENLNTLYNVFPVVKQEEKIIIPAAVTIPAPVYKKPAANKN